MVKADSCTLGKGGYVAVIAGLAALCPSAVLSWGNTASQPIFQAAGVCLATEATH